MASIERTEQNYRELIARDEEMFSTVPLGPEEDFRRIIAADLERLDLRTQLAVGPDFPVTALKLQAIKGHMTEGHGLFYLRYGDDLQRVRYPFKTFEEIVAAVNWDLEKVIQPLERNLARIRMFVDQALEAALPSKPLSPRLPRPTESLEEVKAEEARYDPSASGMLGNIPFTIAGKPIVDVLPLPPVLDPKKFLEGFVIGSYVDNFRCRRKAAKNGHDNLHNLREPYSLGGGEMYFLNLRSYWDRFGSHTHLHQIEHTDDHLEMLTKQGILTSQRSNGETVQFVRRKSGYGTSDDLTLILVGKLYLRISPEAAASAMAGVYAADLVDTLDKHGMHPLLEGHDEHIASHIQQSWKEKIGQELVPEELITFIIYHAAKATHDPFIPISSSQRRLLQYQGQYTGRAATTALKSHHRFVLQGHLSRDVLIGFSEVNGGWFYAMASQRVRQMNTDAEKKGIYDLISS